VLDDEIARGTTLEELLDQLAEQQVQSVRIACTHGLFCHGALDRLAARPEVSEIVCTNTVPIPADGRPAKLTVLSVGPALAEAIRRIHDGESVSALFDPAAG
jgi:ribose-phosphate pyrophosphokinase